MFGHAILSSKLETMVALMRCWPTVELSLLKELEVRDCSNAQKKWQSMKGGEAFL